MASYHLSTDIVKRSLGYSAVAASAYANGIDFYNERAGKLEAYGRKRGIFHSEILAPESAPDWIFNRHELWNRVERFEKRGDAQVARTMVLALPHELPDEDKIAIVNEFARDMFVSQGFVVDAGFHRADRRGDQRNDHAHLVISLRPVEDDDFAKKKPRDFMDKEEKLEFWRERWAFYQNKALEEAGFDTKVDHRTLEEQGIDREATVHMGRKAMLLERRGEQSELGDINREIEGHNRQIDALVNELAALNAEIAQDLEEEFTALEPEAEFSEPEGEVSLEEGAVGKKEPAGSEAAAQEGVFQMEAISNPLNLPASVWGEINMIRDVFKEATAREEARLEASPPEKPERTWEEQKASVNLFNSPIIRAYEADIKQHGEIKERGIGRRWFDRTVALFENLYYGIIDYGKTALEKLMGGTENPEPDQDIEPEDYEPGG